MEKVKAKKEFGQNFLKDSTVLDKIIQSMPH
ncbi:16S rRNA (adenine(1518)-N(6)/adenine(1519)-N(6))-dimethyltransferase, partial [Aliarcobacter skirrowii]|nr:16S rRNA (adenine(1518)-N(6)/adenine(1519)-N(6))-dimethyltransferase [Aliarcobacter skirrowii]